MECIQKSPETGGDGCAPRNEKAPADTEAFRKTTSKAHYSRRLPPYGKQLISRGENPAILAWRVEL